MTKRPVSGVIVYVTRKDREVLFLRRSGGQYEDGWWPVAGTKRDDETPEDCARRELTEETGIVATELLDFGMFLPHYSGESELQVFVCPVPDDTSITLNYEHDDLTWMTGPEAVEFVPKSSRVYLQHLADNFLTGS